MDFFDILKQIMLPCKDNGLHFTDTQRPEKINDLLLYSKYKRVNTDGLFVLYSAKPLCEIPSPIIVSSHIDSVMTAFFTREIDEDTIIGTYDNCITNAAVLTLMLDGGLDDNIIVAFTGDEECDSKGAMQLCDFLRQNKITPLATVVLDVTDMGWNKADFTIENNFWQDYLGRKIIKAILHLDLPWRFVPSYLDNVPDYVPHSFVIPEEADADESWSYDEEKLECFSLCIPVRGHMHCNYGVLARKSSCLNYIKALGTILHSLTK